MAIVPLSLFYLLSFIPLLIFLKPLSLALRQWCQSETEDRQLQHKPLPALEGLPLVPLLATTGIGIFLLLFSLVGRVVHSYFLIVPICYALMICISIALLKQEKKSARPSTVRIWKQDLKASAPFLIFFFVLHIFLWCGRSFFSDIHFDPNHFGAEKLFNYHFQQGFTHGTGFPPPDLWLANERVSYYVLPKTLAGLASFFTRELTGNALSGGLLFHFTDTFFVALSSTVLASGVDFFIKKSSGKSSSTSTTFALLVGLMPLLSAPARALKQTFSGNMDLWSLSRIIDNTINEYPFWNYLWADNHAHSAVLFLQLTFMFWVMAFFSKENWQKPLYTVCIASLAPVILMSHSGSVLIDLVVLGVLAIFLIVSHRSQNSLKDFILASSNLIALVVILSAPDYFSRGQPQVKWYFVPPSLASTIFEFLNINQVMLIFLSGLILLVLPSALKPSHKRRFPEDIALGVHFGLFMLASAVGYPAVGLSLFLAGLAVFALEHSEGHRLSHLRKGCLYAAMLTWIFPELIASNFDMGEKYMRYNSLFRFLFESFYVIPFLWLFSFSPALANIFRQKNPQFIFFATALPVFAVLLFVQFKTFENRVERVATTHSFDGTDFLQTERKDDWAIIKFVASLPGPVVLAEECGMQPKPSAYSVAGRISAYSGRPALCGWSNHTQQFQSTLKYGAFKGTGVWDQLINRNEWINQVMALSADKSSTDPALKLALENFQKVGVTHLVFGEWEKQMHPKVQLASLARLGTVVFEQNGTGVIELVYQP